MAKALRHWPAPPETPELGKIPFDLSRALAGAPLITRDGREATNFRPIKKNTPELYPFEARVGNSTPCFTVNGTCWLHGNDPLDLFIDGGVR